MARAVMAGPRDKLPSVIATLHEMKLIHIIDHHGEDETFRIGKPLPPAADLSENLVKLRSIANLLAVKTPPKKKETVRIEELRGKILTLELNITEEDAARKKAEALLSDLDRRIDELRPFAALELALETYRGYGTIAVLVVEVDKAEAPLRFAVSDHSFVIDGWLPSARSAELRERFEAMGIFVESEEPHRSHEPEEPPVLLRNPKPVRPFEFLVHLYSTPNYHELDPTQFLSLAAQFFFGFMYE